MKLNVRKVFQLYLIHLKNHMQFRLKKYKKESLNRNISMELLYMYI